MPSDDEGGHYMPSAACVDAGSAACVAQIAISAQLERNQAQSEHNQSTIIAQLERNQAQERNNSQSNSSRTQSERNQ